MIRSGVYVGSAVDQKGNAFGCRDQRGKRRSLDTFDPAYDHLAAYQNSSGASGRYEGICFLFFYKI